MRRTIIALVLLALASGLVGCGKSAPAGEPVMEVVGIDGDTKSLTLEELKELTAYEGWGGSVSSTGRVTPPAMIRGVELMELCELVGGLHEGEGVCVVAEDGYAMTMSYEQIMNGDFPVYDPGTDEETEKSEPLHVVVVYERDGEPLPEREDGTLRLGLASGAQNIVTDGHWWVKWVSQIVVKSLSEDWSLHLEGALSEDMDRNTFESCASPSCHGVSWTDDHAQTWSGVPLWLLAGRVDDEEPHKDEAFNRELAAAGYTLDVVAADGYSATLDVARIQQVADILVAYMVNENPLDEGDFPLRLVGDGLTGGEMVGQITSIVVHPPESQAGESAAAPTEEPEPTEAAPAAEPQDCDGALGVSGAVSAPACWSLGEFELIGAVARTVEHPKKGAQDYTGMLLQALFTLAQPAEGASTVTFIAGDGYSIELPLADVLSCADCMVALDGEGGLLSVMPGFEGANWVKDLASIVVE